MMLIVLPSESANAAIKAGTKCKTLGSEVQSGGKRFTCIKLGKFLYWSNGTTSKPTPKPTNSSSSGSGFNPASAFIKPTPVTTASVKWSEDNLVFDIEWDSKDPKNAKAKFFIFEFTINEKVYKSSRSEFPVIREDKQSLSLTRLINQSIFGIAQTNFQKICIYVTDEFYNESPKYCISDIPKYVLPIAPPKISVSPITNGYQVIYTTPTSDLFDAIQIVEFVSSSTSEPTSVNFSTSAWVRDNPVNVITQNFNPRWVKARFSSKFGIWTEYSNAVLVTPINPIQIR